jgi:hypothetical protein
MSVIRNNLKSADRIIRKKLQDKLYHDYHRRQAKAAYSNIVKQFPGRSLAPATVRRIRDYSRDVLGSVRFAPWLEVYTAFRGEFIEGWIPDNYFGRILAPSWRTYPGIDRKTTSRRILGTDRLPDIAYHINGSWIDTGNEPIDGAILTDVLFRSGPEVFVKRDGFAQGAGVSRVTRKDFDPAAIARLGNLVVQTPIRQHPLLAELSPASVATLRITTVKPPGASAEMRAAMLRVGSGNEATMRIRNEIDISVTDAAGTLDDKAADDGWTTFFTLPATGIAFAGRVIPGFAEAVRFCTGLHDRSPFSMVVGWDVAIDEAADPVLIEWNTGHVDVAHSEASVGPCYRGLGWEDAWKRA